MKKPVLSIVRALTVLLVFVFLAIGLLFNLGTGSLSSIGYSYIATICPLGALETLLGARGFILRIVIALVLMMLVIVVFGKAFCSWLCPVPHLRNFFSTRKSRAREDDECTKAAEVALENYRHDKKPERKKFVFDSRHGILGAALLSALIFGFPVFCLVCPVGLVFATFIAVWNLVGSNDVSWSLLVYPGILLIELLFLRKWCIKFCPISALLSLLSPANRLFRPKVDKTRCQRIVDGKDCGVCSSVCPEYIDPHSDLGLRPITECTKCNICAEKCPTQAISLCLMVRKSSAK